jgi:excisionase family DNA binding protein
MQRKIIFEMSESELKDLITSSLKECLNDFEIISDKNNKKGSILTVAETAEYLKLAKQTIYSYTSNRTIPFFKKGKKLYFKIEEIHDWINMGKKLTSEEILQNDPIARCQKKLK